MHQTTSNLVSFYDWLESLGRTRGTGWRWRKKGIIQAVNVFGKLYISRDEIARFESRAMAGEFASENNVPKKTKRR